MNHKVLLADDSLTIQKVIKITLANQPFDIVDCATDEELFKKLPEVRPELVFLDFNLSEKFTGYELTSKIKAACPNARVLLLLGTFDTVDEAAMERCGASDKIVKPFDSNKFIAICKRLADTAPVEEIKFPETKKEELHVPNEEDHWQVENTIETTTETKIEEQPTKEFNVSQYLNPLDQEVSEWGMSIPSVIDDKTAHEKAINLPPVIGEVKLQLATAASTSKPAAKEEIKFPESDDLDYPTIEELESAKEPAIETKPQVASKLISIESFSEPEEFEIEHSINSVDETDVSSIEAQIRDEVEENLWKVDEFEDLKEHLSAKIEEAVSNFKAAEEKQFDESLFKPLDENEEIQWAASNEHISFEPEKSFVEQRPVATTTATGSVSQEEIIQQLRSEVDEMIKKHVKEYMDQMFQQKVEKISWEVIPDLAENLIRQEISKISNKILSESN